MFKWIKNGGITSPKKFRASGISAGIKPKNKKDMAMLVSDCGAIVATAFTTNKIKAAPVKVSMEYSRNGAVRGVIYNSGNANACTGLRGIKDAKRMTDLSCLLQDLKKRQMLVCSTGEIGIYLPMKKVEQGIRKLIKKLSSTGGSSAAEAIMTSDTVPKQCAVTLKIDDCRVTIGAMAKGAGMIHPNMATTLCCVTTDARIDKKTFQRCLHDAVDKSFNRISVDGETSTNDTILAFANSSAGNNMIKSYHPKYDLFCAALRAVLNKLARMIIEDGEGHSKVIEISVQGASHATDARLVAEAVARSPLVKCSWYGGTPDWGRLMCALGHSGAHVREELVEIYYDGLVAVRGGTASATPVKTLRKVTRKRSYTIHINLHLGKGKYKLLTNDLTEDYIKINKV